MLFNLIGYEMQNFMKSPETQSMLDLLNHRDYNDQGVLITYKMFVNDMTDVLVSMQMHLDCPTPAQSCMVYFDTEMKATFVQKISDERVRLAWYAACTMMITFSIKTCLSVWPILILTNSELAMFVLYRMNKAMFESNDISLDIKMQMLSITGFDYLIKRFHVIYDPDRAALLLRKFLFLENIIQDLNIDGATIQMVMKESEKKDKEVQKKIWGMKVLAPQFDTLKMFGTMI
jgi:hypothetical protein